MSQLEVREHKLAQLISGRDDSNGGMCVSIHCTDC